MLPLLQDKKNKRVSRVVGIDSAFLAARDQGAIEHADYLVAHLEKMAKEHAASQV